MRKIANTAELQSELERLIAYAQTANPSRARLAGELDELGARVASQGASLLQAKIDWAMELAEIMRARFSGAGGWRDHHIESQIHRTNSGVAIYMESKLGWHCNIDITAEGAPQVDVHFNVSAPKPPSTGPEELPNLEDLDLSKLIGKPGPSVSFLIKDREPMAKAMMDVSLWLSKQLK